MSFGCVAGASVPVMLPQSYPDATQDDDGSVETA